MTARDEKWESAFNHLHGLSKLTRTIKFLENEGESAASFAARRTAVRAVADRTA